MGMNNSINMLIVHSDVSVIPYKDPEMERLRCREKMRRKRLNPEFLYGEMIAQRERRLDPLVRERENKYSLQWNEDHRGYLREYARTKRQQTRIDLLILLGGKCMYCDYNKDVRGLCVDHINGGGTREERETFNGNSHAMYRYYLDHPEEAKKKLQVLCGTCNQIKRYTHHEGVMM